MSCSHLLRQLSLSVVVLRLVEGLRIIQIILLSFVLGQRSLGLLN
jgi:hypothetical protein